MTSDLTSAKMYRTLCAIQTDAYFTLLYFHGVWSVNAAELKPTSDVTRRRRNEVEMKRLTTVIRDNVSRLKRPVKKRQSNTTLLTIVYDTIEEFKVD